MLDLLDTVLGRKWGLRVAIAFVACLALVAAANLIAALVNK